MSHEPFDEADRELLADLLSGARSEGEPEVASRLRDNPALAAELAELRALAGDLGAGGVERWQEIDQARQAVTQADVQAAMRLIETHGPPRRLLRRKWLLVSALAAALVAVLVVTQWPRDSGRTQPVNPSLGNSAPAVGARIVREHGGLVIRWPDGTVRAGSRLKLVVYREVDGKRSDDVVFKKDGLEGSQWEPTPAVIEQLRALEPYWWELRRIDGDIDAEGKRVSEPTREPAIGSAPTRTGNRPAAAEGAAALVAPVLRRFADSGGDNNEWLGIVDDLMDELRVGTRLLDLGADRSALLGVVEAARASCVAEARPLFDCGVLEVFVELGWEDEARKLSVASFTGDLSGRFRDRQQRAACADELTKAAEMAHFLGEFDLAVDLARHAQHVASNISNNWLADAHGAEARVWIDLGMLDVARGCRRRQSELIAALKQPVFRVLCNEAVIEAEYLLKQDRIEDSIAWLEGRLLRLAERGPKAEDVAMLAGVQLKLGVARLVLAEKHHVVDQATETSLRELLTSEAEEGFKVVALTMLTRAALLRADLKAARADLARLRELRQPADDAYSMRARGAPDAETLATRVLLAEHRVTPVAAEQLAEQLRRHRAAFERLLEEWRGTNITHGGVGFLAFAHRRQLITELVRLTVAVHGRAAAARTALEDVLRVQALTSMARGVAVGAAAADEVRSLFTSDGAGVLVFLGDPNGSLLLAFDGDGEHLIELAGGLEIETAVGKLQAALNDAAQDGDREASGRRLLAASAAVSDRLLCDEVRALLQRWRAVTIADHGMLACLPWECLQWRPGTLLGEHLPVNTLTSLPLGLALAAARAKLPRVGPLAAQFVGTLGAAAELVDAAADRTTRLSDAQVGSMLECYGKATIQLNEQATVAAARALRADVSVTHLLGHGVIRTAEMGSALALAPLADGNGAFGSEQVHGIGLTGLVVVSACGVGRSHRRIGDDPLYATLGGALLREGAHTVIQSCADLHLLTHLVLMQQVHKAIAGGTPVAAALCAARSAAAASADWVDRFENAQVQAFGLGHLSVLPEGTERSGR